MTRSNTKKKTGMTALFRAALAGLLGASTSGAGAQSASGGGLGPGWAAPDPSPYYIGVSQALTHETNLYRSLTARSGNYSSTSLFGGFNQPISRQRVFGSARVSLNRYFDESSLNNTSYSLASGIAWETIHKLSGNVNVSVERNLAAPAVVGVMPQTRRSLATTTSLDTRARWGGDSLLSLEGALGYMRVNYSLPEYASQELERGSGSLGFYYRPGGLLRLGVAARLDRTENPEAMKVPWGHQSGTTRSRNLDLLADYSASRLVSASGRLSYTKQTYSLSNDPAFSGLTGSFSLAYQPAGKLGYTAYVAREAGVSTTPFTNTALTQNGPFLVLTPINGLYQNNQVTTSVGGSFTYAATEKISAAAGARYSRAVLNAVLFEQNLPETIDVAKVLYVSTKYAFSRRLVGSCRASHERRSLSGALSYSYTNNALGCEAQYTWD